MRVDPMKRILSVLVVLVAIQVSARAESTATPTANTAAPAPAVSETRPVKPVRLSVLWGLIQFNSGPLPEDCKDRCKAGRKERSDKGSRGSFLGGAVQWEGSGPDSRSR